ncbi:MAG TPA: tyrosine-type recombinase/integrase [Streptosporangiaceae bacterium]|jgi:integrase
MSSKFDGKIETGIYFRYLRDRSGSVRKGRNGKPLRTFTHRYYDANGKEQQDTYKTLDDARKAGKRDTRAAVATGTHIDKQKGKTLLGEYVETVCLPTVKAMRAPSTASGYRSCWNAVRSQGTHPIKDIAMGKLTREHLQTAFDAYAPGHKATTIHETWNALKRFLESAFTDGYTNLDPRRVKLTLPTVTPADLANTRRAVPMNDYWTVRGHAEQHTPGAGDLLDLGCGLGLRSGEARAFDANKIDFTAGTYLVDAQLMGTRKTEMWLAPPKHGRTRTVPIAPVILAQLKRRITDAPPAERTMTYRNTNATTHNVTARLIFLEPDGNPMRARYLCDIVAYARTKAKITGKLTFHTLRHTYVSQLMHNGETRTNIAWNVGHAHPGVTDSIYTHMIEHDQATTNTIMNTVMTPPPTPKTA